MMLDGGSFFYGAFTASAVIVLVYNIVCLFEDDRPKKKEPKVERIYIDRPEVSMSDLNMLNQNIRTEMCRVQDLELRYRDGLTRRMDALENRLDTLDHQSEPFTPEKTIEILEATIAALKEEK